MSDFSRHGIADKLHAWHDLTRQVDELRREIEEERHITASVAAERNDLRATVADLIEQNADLRARLDTMRDERDKAQARTRQTDWLAGARAFALTLTGRTR
jgi:chromosome segregation ATPase